MQSEKLHAATVMENLIKEQREPKQRRHQQQGQQVHSELRITEQTVAVKRDEITGLHQEGVPLGAALLHVRAALLGEQDKTRALELRIQLLQAVEHRFALLSARFTKCDAQALALAEQLNAAADFVNVRRGHCVDGKLGRTPFSGT